MTDYTDLIEMDGLAEMLEDLDLGEDIESDEADFLERNRRRGRSRFRQPPRTAPGRGLYQPRPSGNYVTQTQLQTALAKVGQQINTNSEAIKTLNTRVAAVSGEVAAANAAVRKEIVDRKKESGALRRQVRQVQDLAGITPLLLRPETITTTEAVGGIPVGTRVMVDTGNTLTSLLPLLLFSGLGTGGETGSGSGSGDGGIGSNALLLFALLGRR